MRVLFVLAAVVAVYRVESCCVPNKFKMNWDMFMTGHVMHPAARVRMNGTINNGEFSIDGENSDVYVNGDGEIVAGARGRVIRFPFSMNMGIDQGRSLWIKASVQVPGRGRISKCHYLRIRGDIPYGYACYDKVAKKIDNDSNGNRRYRASAPPFFEGIVTVNDQCLPIREKVNFAFAQNGMAMEAQVTTSTSNRQVGVARDRPVRRPAGCIYKDTIDIPPPSEGSPEKLMQEEVKLVSSRRKRAVDSAKETVTRVARDTMDDVIANFLP